MNLFSWKKKQIKKEIVNKPFTLDFSGIPIEDFKRMMQYGKSSDTIGIYKSSPFIELPYGIVKVKVPLLLRKNNPAEVIKAVLSCQFKEIDLSSVNGNECLCFILWIKEQMEFIAQKEEQNLVSPPKAELVAAGIHKLDEFVGYTTIDSLAGGLLKDHKIISDMPYYEVYKKLKLDKIQREIEEAYSKIMEKKK